MRNLTATELRLVVGGSRIPNNNQSGSGSTTNPTHPGSGSAADQARQSFADGNVFTGMGQIISGAPEIVGNGLDGLTRMLGNAIYDHANSVYQSYMPRTPRTSEEAGLRPRIPAD